VAVVVGEVAYLVDAGPGIVRRAAQAARDDSIHALEPARLRRVFITHLHSDHTVGLPDLMLSPWVLGRTDPLDVFGPRGTRRMVDLLEQAYSEDVQIRLHGGEPSNRTGYAAVAHDVGAGIVYRDSNVTVTAFNVQHGKWYQAFGYRFATRDRVVVISGDTSPSDAGSPRATVRRACPRGHWASDWDSSARVAPVSRGLPTSTGSGDIAAGAAETARLVPPALLGRRHARCCAGQAKYRGNVVSAKDLEVLIRSRVTRLILRRRQIGAENLAEQRSGAP
jgi:hypothetical protein